MPHGRNPIHRFISPVNAPRFVAASGPMWVARGRDGVADVSGPAAQIIDIVQAAAGISVELKGGAADGGVASRPASSSRVQARGI